LADHDSIVKETWKRLALKVHAFRDRENGIPTFATRMILAEWLARYESPRGGIDHLAGFAQSLSRFITRHALDDYAPLEIVFCRAKVMLKGQDKRGWSATLQALVERKAIEVVWILSAQGIPGKPFQRFKIDEALSHGVPPLSSPGSIRNIAGCRFRQSDSARRSIQLASSFSYKWPGAAPRRAPLHALLIGNQFVFSNRIGDTAQVGSYPSSSSPRAITSGASCAPGAS
jgi:hypothetical protein